MELQYDYQIKQELSTLIQKCFNDKAKHQLFKDDVILTFLTSLRHELDIFCDSNSFKLTQHSFNDTTLTVEINTGYGSMFLLCAVRAAQVFCSVYSTIDDIQMKIFEFNKSMHNDDLLKTQEIARLKDKVSKLENENIYLKRKLDAYSGAEVKKTLQSIISNIESFETEDKDI